MADADSVPRDIGATLKALDKAIDGGEENLFQLYFNRGFCNQRLQLYRKALKVRPDPPITGSAPRWPARSACCCPK